MKSDTPERKLKHIKPEEVHVEPEVGMHQKNKEEALEEWPEIKPLPTGKTRVKALSRDLLPEPLAEWVFDNAARMGCPPDYFAIPLIIAIGMVIGTSARLYPKIYGTWYEVANLFGFVAGPPGSKKSPAMEAALESLKLLEKEANKVYQEEYKEYLKKKKQYDLDYSDYRKDKNRNEGEEPVEPELPVQKRFYTSDSTIPKLALILRDNPNGLGIHRDELFGLWKYLDAAGHESDREFIKQGHSGKGSYTVDRKGDGTIHVPSLCLSIVGCINDDILSEYVKIAMTTKDDGFLQRHQISTMPDDMVDNVPQDRKPKVPQSTIDRIFLKMASIPGSKPFGELGIFHFTEDAQKMFNKYQHDLNYKVRDEKISPPLQNHFSKYEKLVLSLALIFHVLEWVTTKKVVPVGVDALERALMWAEYLESHAHRIYSTTLSLDMKAAQSVLRQIKNKKLTDGMTLREVQQHDWAGLTDHKMVYDTMKYLEEQGYLRMRQEGKKPAVIRLNPNLS